MSVVAGQAAFRYSLISSPRGVRTGVVRTFIRAVLKILSKVSMNWLARSRTSARASASWWP